jgi:uncharacterized protein YheU (UPF0270 family)
MKFIQKIKPVLSSIFLSLLFIIYFGALVCFGNLLGGVGCGLGSTSSHEPAASHIAHQARLSMNNNGKAVIAWSQLNDSIAYQIFKGEYLNGAWVYPSGPSDNVSPGGYDGADPQVATDNNGNVIIVWSESNGHKDQIYKSEYRNGSWSYPSSLNDSISPTDQDAFQPQVAMDNSGNAIIVWRQYDGSFYQIFKSEYRSGAWTHPTGIDDNVSPGGGGAADPRIAMDDSGNALIVWNQYDGNFYQIFKSEYRSGAWTHPSALSDNISPDGQSTSENEVAMDNNGNAIIVWSQNDGTVKQIFKSEYRSGAWTNPANLADNISPDSLGSLDPHVAMDDDGNALIVWRQSDGSFVQVFKSDYRNGTWVNPTGPTDNISPDNQNVSDVNVAMDDNGNAIIVWGESDGSFDQVFKSEYRNGVWTHPTGLTDNISPNGQITSDAQVAMDNNGNALIVWTQSNGTSPQVFKSEYRTGTWVYPTDLADNITPF